MKLIICYEKNVHIFGKRYQLFTFCFLKQFLEMRAISKITKLDKELQCKEKAIWENL